MGVTTVIKDYGTDILNAIRENNLDRMRAILEKQLRTDRKIAKLCIADIKHKPTKKFACPLILAARQEDSRIIRYMLEKGTDPNFIHHTIFSSKRREIVTALHIAVDLGLYDSVRALLDYRADSNVGDHNAETPLHIAVKKCDRQMVRMLLSKGANPGVPDRRGNAALHMATLYGHLDLVRSLLKHDADVYQKGYQDAIAPHIAAKEGHIHLIQLFCARDEGNINIKIPCFTDEREKAPLHLAAENGHVETVLALLDQFEAEVNLKDSDGNTALHCAVLNPYDPHIMRERDYFTECARVLIKYRTSINEKNVFGDTALHLAAMNHFQRIVELLLEVGANPNAENDQGLRPLDVVPDSDPVTKQLLKQAMLQPRPSISASMDTLSIMSKDSRFQSQVEMRQKMNRTQSDMSFMSDTISIASSVFDEPSRYKGGQKFLIPSQKKPKQRKETVRQRKLSDSIQEGQGNVYVEIEHADPKGKPTSKGGKESKHAPKQHGLKQSVQTKVNHVIAQNQYDDDDESVISKGSFHSSSSSHSQEYKKKYGSNDIHEAETLRIDRHQKQQQTKKSQSLNSSSSGDMSTQTPAHNVSNASTNTKRQQKSSGVQAGTQVSATGAQTAPMEEDDPLLYENYNKFREDRLKKKRQAEAAKITQQKSVTRTISTSSMSSQRSQQTKEQSGLHVQNVAGKPGTIELQYGGGPITISVDQHGNIQYTVQPQAEQDDTESQSYSNDFAEQVDDDYDQQLDQTGASQTMTPGNKSYQHTQEIQSAIQDKVLEYTQTSQGRQRSNSIESDRSQASQGGIMLQPGKKPKGHFLAHGKPPVSDKGHQHEETLPQEESVYNGGRLPEEESVPEEHLQEAVVPEAKATSPAIPDDSRMPEEEPVPIEHIQEDLFPPKPKVPPQITPRQTPTKQLLQMAEQPPKPIPTQRQNVMKPSEQQSHIPTEDVPKTEDVPRTEEGRETPTKPQISSKPKLNTKPVRALHYTRTASLQQDEDEGEASPDLSPNSPPKYKSFSEALAYAKSQENSPAGSPAPARRNKDPIISTPETKRWSSDMGVKTTVVEHKQDKSEIIRVKVQQTQHSSRLNRGRSSYAASDLYASNETLDDLDPDSEEDNEVAVKKLSQSPVLKKAAQHPQESHDLFYSITGDVDQDSNGTTEVHGPAGKPPSGKVHVVEQTQLMEELHIKTEVEEYEQEPGAKRFVHRDTLPESPLSPLSPNTSFSSDPGRRGIGMHVTADAPKAWNRKQKPLARKAFYNTAPIGIESDSENDMSLSMSSLPDLDVPGGTASKPPHSKSMPTIAAAEHSPRSVKLIGSSVPKPYKSFGKIETNTDALMERLEEGGEDYPGDTSFDSPTARRRVLGNNQDYINARTVHSGSTQSWQATEDQMRVNETNRMQRFSASSEEVSKEWSKAKDELRKQRFPNQVSPQPQISDTNQDDVFEEKGKRSGIEIPAQQRRDSPGLPSNPLQEKGLATASPKPVLSPKTVSIREETSSGTVTVTTTVKSMTTERKSDLVEIVNAGSDEDDEEDEIEKVEDYNEEPGIIRPKKLIGKATPLAGVLAQQVILRKTKSKENLDIEESSEPVPTPFGQALLRKTKSREDLDIEEKPAPAPAQSPFGQALLRKTKSREALDIEETPEPAAGPPERQEFGGFAAPDLQSLTQSPSAQRRRHMVPSTATEAKQSEIPKEQISDIQSYDTEPGQRQQQPKESAKEIPAMPYLPGYEQEPGRRKPRPKSKSIETNLDDLSPVSEDDGEDDSEVAGISAAAVEKQKRRAAKKQQDITAQISTEPGPLSHVQQDENQPRVEGRNAGALNQHKKPPRPMPVQNTQPEVQAPSASQPAPPVHPTEPHYANLPGPQGQGQMPMQGQGQIPMQGQGQVPVEGQGQVPIEGQGHLPVHSQGQVHVQGHSQVPLQSQDQMKGQGPMDNETKAIGEPEQPVLAPFDTSFDSESRQVKKKGGFFSLSSLRTKKKDKKEKKLKARGSQENILAAVEAEKHPAKTATPQDGASQYIPPDGNHAGHSIQYPNQQPAPNQQPRVQGRGRGALNQHRKHPGQGGPTDAVVAHMWQQQQQQQLPACERTNLAEVAPSQPDEVAPSQPDEVAPSQPDEVAPSQPGEVAPSQPDEVSEFSVPNLKAQRVKKTFPQAKEAEFAPPEYENIPTSRPSGPHSVYDSEPGRRQPRHHNAPVEETNLDDVGPNRGNPNFQNAALASVMHQQQSQRQTRPTQARKGPSGADLAAQMWSQQHATPKTQPIETNLDDLSPPSHQKVPPPFHQQQGQNQPIETNLDDLSPPRNQHVQPSHHLPANQQPVQHPHDQGQGPMPRQGPPHSQQSIESAAMAGIIADLQKEQAAKHDSPADSQGPKFIQGQAAQTLQSALGDLDSEMQHHRNDTQMVAQMWQEQKDQEAELQRMLEATKGGVSDPAPSSPEKAPPPLPSSQPPPMPSSQPPNAHTQGFQAVPQKPEGVKETDIDDDLPVLEPYQPTQNLQAAAMSTVTARVQEEAARPRSGSPGVKPPLAPKPFRAKPGPVIIQAPKPNPVPLDPAVVSSLWAQEHGIKPPSKAEVVNMDPSRAPPGPQHGGFAPNEAYAHPQQSVPPGGHGGGEPHAPGKSLQDAALESLQSGLQNQPKPRKGTRGNPNPNITYTRGVYRPQGMHMVGSGTGRYGDSEIAYSDDRHRSMATESEGEADADVDPNEYSEHSPRGPASESSSYYGVPSSHSGENKENFPSAFTPVSPSHSQKRVQITDRETGMGFMPQHKPKRQKKYKPPRIMEPGPVDFNQYDATARIWMEQVDKKTVEKSKTMYMSMPETSQIPEDIQQRLPYENPVSDDDVFLPPQWIIARGRSLRRRKQVQTTSTTSSERVTSTASGMVSDSDMEMNPERPLSPGKQSLLFFRIGSNWADLAWLLFTPVQKEADTIRMIKDIKLKNPNNLREQVQDMMRRWWKKRGTGATIEELQSSLNYLRMGYINEDYFNEQKGVTSYNTDTDDDLDVSEISDNDPDVSRLMDEYKVRSLNSSFELEPNKKYSSINRDQMMAAMKQKGLMPSTSSYGAHNASHESLEYMSDSEPGRRAFVIVQPQLKSHDYRHESNV